MDTLQGPYHCGPILRAIYGGWQPRILLSQIGAEARNPDIQWLADSFNGRARSPRSLLGRAAVGIAAYRRRHTIATKCTECISTAPILGVRNIALHQDLALD